MRGMRWNKHLVAAGFVVAFSVAMVITAASGHAAGSVCRSAPHELVMNDPECQAPSSNANDSDVSARSTRSSESGLGWFAVSVVVGLAVLAAVALERPSTRPFVPRPDGARV